MLAYLNKPYFFGFGGNNIVERIADSTKPNIAIVIKVLVTAGKLADSTVALNLSPPSKSGIQPTTAMIKAFVAQEWKPYNCARILDIIFFFGSSRQILTALNIK